MPTNTEGGLRNHRIEFVRESTTGEFNADPSWNYFSDTMLTFEWAPDSEIGVQRGIGNPDPSDFFKGPETHEVTVSYNMQEWPSGSGDASYDGLTRDSDNLLPNTHTIVDREDKGSISSEETVNGSTSLSTRIYTVGRGGFIDEVSLSGDPGDQQPVNVELSYQFEKVRSYQIDQPSSSTTLTASSSDDGDTSQKLTIEDEGANTTEEVSLNGTTEVTTTASFSDIDALELDAETVGDITVTDGSDNLAVIPGSDTYNGIEGDLGVPALGSGSHATDIGSTYETILGDKIERPASTNLAYDINSIELSVSNNLDTSERTDSLKQRILVGQRDTEVSASVMGEAESHDEIMEHLKVTTNNIKWTLDGGNFEITSAALTGPGSRTIEDGEAAMTLDNTFTGKGLTIN